MTKEIPLVIKDSLQEAATAYANSEATTDLGRIGRFFARIIPVSFVIQLFAHKLKKVSDV
jgi:hypothetical protein